MRSPSTPELVASHEREVRLRDNVPLLDVPEPPPSDFTTRPSQRITVHPGIPVNSYRRLRRFADYGNYADCLFSLTRVPEDISWDRSRHDSTLSFEGTQLAVRAVASVIGVGMFGNDPSHMFFDLDPLRPVDHEGMLRLLDFASPPPVISAESMRIIWTAEPQRPSPPVIHDATSRLRPPALMQIVDFHTLAYGDVVMADFVVVKGTTDSGWDALFEYQSMVILAKPTVDDSQ